jgi:hypothetical protein
LSWLIPLVEQDRAARRQIRQLERDIDAHLDEHGTTLRDKPGIGPTAAATLIVEVGDPFRFMRESKFARWCGTGAIALSSGEGAGLPVKHRLDFRGNRRINSVLYITSVTQQRHIADARIYIDRKLGEGKTRREARRAHQRHLANRVIRRMWKDKSDRHERPAHLAARHGSVGQSQSRAWVSSSRTRRRPSTRTLPASVMGSLLPCTSHDMWVSGWVLGVGPWVGKESPMRWCPTVTRSVSAAGELRVGVGLLLVSAGRR